MREVADLESGNFRGVCPILNRAKELRTAQLWQLANHSSAAAVYLPYPDFAVTPVTPVL